MGSWRDAARRALITVLLLGVVTLVAFLFGRSEHAKASTWSFIDAPSSEPVEVGLVAQSASGGAWVIEEHSHATGGRALVNHEGTLNGEPAVIIARSSRARDLRASTRCKVVANGNAVNDAAAGLDASACGVVFRYLDAQNHWIARLDVPSSTVEVVFVSRGVPRVIGHATTASSSSSSSKPLALDEWIDLRVEARGDVVRVAVNGAPTLIAEAPLVPAVFGSVGLWAPSQAKVYFDDFTIETLIPAPQALETLPLLGKGAQT